MKNKLQIILISLFIFPALLFGGGWSTGVPLNTARQGAAVVTHGGYIYVFGGKTLNNTILNTVERFNPVTQQWESSASFTTPRMGAAAIVFGDSIFLTGGRDQFSGEALKEVEIYNVAQNQWHSAQDMRREREGHTLAFFNNRIYAIGGQKEENEYEEEIEYYDTQDDDWRQAPFDIASKRVAFFSGVVNDTFYMCGGFYYGPTNNSFIKPPLTLNWISGPTMFTPRGNGASALFGDSLFFMMGGETQSGISDIVEIYDIYNWQIIPGPNLLIARKGMTATTLNNKIYVIGGVTAQSGGLPVKLVEVYDEPTGIRPSINPDLIIQGANLVGYPNPFNSRIKLEFKIPKSSYINLTIFDIQGRIINKLVNEHLFEGTHSINWEGNDSQNRQVSSGIYFAILKGDSFYQKFKLFYVK